MQRGRSVSSRATAFGALALVATVTATTDAFAQTGGRRVVAFDSIAVREEYPARGPATAAVTPTVRTPVTKQRVLRRSQMSDSLYRAIGERLTLLDDSLLTVDLVAACGQPAPDRKTATLTMYGRIVRQVTRSMECANPAARPQRSAPYIEMERQIFARGAAEPYRPGRRGDRRR